MSTQIISGTFKNVASTPYLVKIVPQISKFYLKNLSMSGITALGVSGSLTSDRIVEAWFYPSFMTAGTASCNQQGTVGSGLAPLNDTYLSAGGFTYVDSSLRSQGPVKSILSFATGSTTVFTTSAAHGFNVGDVVRVYNTTSAPEIGGLAMTVTAVGGGGTTFTTLLNSTNMVTSTGSVRRIAYQGEPLNGLYYPEIRAIASISAANPMVVTTLVQQNYAVGDVVTFNIPSAYGMTDLNAGNNGLPFQATVSAVNNAVGTQTVTFANVDSSAFTAFSWPGATNYPNAFPVMIPQGEGNLNNLTGITPAPLPYGNQDVLSFATQNQGYRGILIGAGSGKYDASTPGIIGSTVDAWYWEATTVAQTYTS